MFGRVTHGFSIGSGSGSIGVLFAIPKEAAGGYDLQIDFGDAAIAWRLNTGTSWITWMGVSPST